MIRATAYPIPLSKVEACLLLYADASTAVERRRYIYSKAELLKLNLSLPHIMLRDDELLVTIERCYVTAVLRSGYFCECHFRVEPKRLYKRVDALNAV